MIRPHFLTLTGIGLTLSLLAVEPANACPKSGGQRASHAHHRQYRPRVTPATLVSHPVPVAPQPPCTLPDPAPEPDPPLPVAQVRAPQAAHAALGEELEATLAELLAEPAPPAPASQLDQRPAAPTDTQQDTAGKAYPDGGLAALRRRH